MSHRPQQLFLSGSHQEHVQNTIRPGFSPPACQQCRRATSSSFQHCSHQEEKVPASAAHPGLDGKQWFGDTARSTTASAAVTVSEGNGELNSRHWFTYTTSSYKLPRKHRIRAYNKQMQLLRFGKEDAVAGIEMTSG